jgi:hypothetical protein
MSRGTEGRSTGSFVRGMTIGALLGAVVAGSSLWSRRRMARRAAALPPPKAPEALGAPEPPRQDGS